MLEQINVKNNLIRHWKSNDTQKKKINQVLVASHKLDMFLPLCWYFQEPFPDRHLALERVFTYVLLDGTQQK